MQNELEDNQEDYRSLTHEYWCDLLSTIKFKENRKREATHINKIDYDRADSHYDSDKSTRVPRKNTSKTGVLHSKPNRKAPRHHVTQSHCILCNKEKTPEQKYILHSDEDYFGKRSYQKSIWDGLVGPMRSRAEDVKYNKK